jgi:hypothetical protein
MLTSCATRAREPKLADLASTTLLTPPEPKLVRRSQRLEPARPLQAEARRAHTSSTPAKPTTRVASDCYNLLDPRSRDRSLVSSGRHRLGASCVHRPLDESARRSVSEPSAYADDSMRRPAASLSTCTTRVTLTRPACYRRTPRRRHPRMASPSDAEPTGQARSASATRVHRTTTAARQTEAPQFLHAEACNAAIATRAEPPKRPDSKCLPTEAGRHNLPPFRSAASDGASERRAKPALRTHHCTNACTSSTARGCRPPVSAQARTLDRLARTSKSKTPP